MKTKKSSEIYNRLSNFLSEENSDSNLMKILHSINELEIESDEYCQLVSFVLRRQPELIGENIRSERNSIFFERENVLIEINVNKKCVLVSTKSPIKYPVGIYTQDILEKEEFIEMKKYVEGRVSFKHISKILEKYECGKSFSEKLIYSAKRNKGTMAKELYLKQAQINFKNNDFLSSLDLMDYKVKEENRECEELSKVIKWLGCNLFEIKFFQLQKSSEEIIRTNCN